MTAPNHLAIEDSVVFITRFVTADSSRAAALFHK